MNSDDGVTLAGDGLDNNCECPVVEGDTDLDQFNLVVLLLGPWGTDHDLKAVLVLPVGPEVYNHAAGEEEQRVVG